MVSRKLTGVLFAGLMALGTGHAMAASQGTLGVTSTATIVITLVIPEKLRVSGMDDLSLGTYSGSGGLSASDDLCVYSNAGDGGYRLRATDTSTMTPTAFSVQNATATATIPFNVRWNSATGTAGNVSVSYNSFRTAANANSLSTDCSVGGNNANVSIAFTEPNLRAAPGGQYATTLNVTVEP